MLRLREATGKLIFVGCIARNQTNKKITAAANHVAFKSFRPRSDHSFKTREDSLLLTVEANQREEHNRPAQRLKISLCPVAGNNTKFFQTTHTSEAGRRGNSGATGKFNIRHTPVSLQFGDDPPIDDIEFRCGHSALSMPGSEWI
ncbi:hypothetical protein AA21952_0435 [Acetobacter oeni LMG 21952]|nr:hypothetical protein AA21952_0435 [Acetobacter oeni LMG 21952]